MKEKKKTIGQLKDQLKDMKMDTAVTIRYTNNERGGLNEHERRLQRTQVGWAGMRAGRRTHPPSTRAVTEALTHVDGARRD